MSGALCEGVKGNPPWALKGDRASGDSISDELDELEDDEDSILGCAGCPCSCYTAPMCGYVMSSTGIECCTLFHAK